MIDFVTTTTTGEDFEYNYKDKLTPNEKVEKIVDLINSELGKLVTEEMKQKISDIVSD